MESKPDHLSPPPSLADPAVVAAFDQAPLWSARFGELALTVPRLYLEAEK